MSCWGTSVIVDGGELCSENLRWIGRACERCQCFCEDDNGLLVSIDAGKVR